jgi:hypothetical protein
MLATEILDCCGTGLEEAGVTFDKLGMSAHLLAVHR